MEKWVLAGLLAGFFYRRGMHGIAEPKKHLCLKAGVFLICLICLNHDRMNTAPSVQQIGYIGVLGLLISAGLSDHYTYSLYFMDECAVSAYWLVLSLQQTPVRLLGAVSVCGMLYLLAKILEHQKHQSVFGNGDYLIIFSLFLAFGWMQGLLILWLASVGGMLAMLALKKTCLPFVPFLGFASLLVFGFS